MKKRLNKIVSLICTLALLVSMCSFVTAFASDEVQIITAQFMPYEGQIKVLASLADGYTDVKVYVNDTEIQTQTDSARTDGYVLFTSTNYTPLSYGIATVKLVATVDSIMYADVEKVTVFKAFSKLESFAQDFESISPMEQATVTDTTVTSAITTDTPEMTFTNIPASSFSNFFNIKNNFNNNSGNCAVMEFEQKRNGTFPYININIEDELITGGIFEIEYDFFGTNNTVCSAIYMKNTIGNQVKFAPDGDTDKSTSYLSVIDHSTKNYAHTSTTPIVNRWYRVRLVMNLNELTYAFYADDMLIENGTLQYNNGNPYVYGIEQIQINMRYNASASATTVRYAGFDNFSVRHTFTGAMPQSMSYTDNAVSSDADMMNALIPSDTDSLFVNMNDTLLCDADAISIQTSDGQTINADISVGEEDTYGRNNVTISSLTLEPSKEYKIVISGEAKSELHGVIENSAYENDIVIPFVTAGTNDFYIQKDVDIDHNNNAVVNLQLGKIGESDDVQVIVATYDGTELVSCKAQTVSVSTLENYTMTITSNGGTTAKVFVWNNLASITPLYIGE